ncbi:hypothetical protein AB7783_12295 [Tardiphaga sp. 172_B4_N1_3]|uniref:glycine-rich domain-containing protein n=1 Tax=Tardiphaga sp. 172_B4_N1_3 TaxID=3240787 RepID=UPI003F89E44B
MSHKVNLVRVLTAATGNSTPITLGARYSDLFMTPAEAGAMDGRVYTYNIVDGNNWEIGRGVYTATGTTLARTTILASRISGTLGTSRISLTGTAQVRLLESAEDMDGVRGTRTVTGTSDTLNNSDQGYVVTYSNASAIAVALAQASSSNLFLDGWVVFVKNKGGGAVTITSATSMIDGAATLVLQQNQGALIWSDGTNYQSFKFRGDLGDSATKNVGTGASTVAAGDDARIIGSVKAVRVRKFTSSGSYTPDPHLLYATIDCLGAGGGGGGTAASTANSVSQGSSGGGGGRSIKYTDAAAVGASQTVTIGAAGAAGTAGSNAGGAGGDTSVGTLCIGKGGAGGPAETARAVASGGVAGTGDVTAPGPTGQTSLYQQPGSMNGYSGPSTIYGAGGVGNFNGAGSAATGYGAGGAGGHDFNAIGAKAGGAGAPGIVIITEYCSQ